MKIFALTLLFFSSSSRCLLHASSLQSGYTADTNTIFFPSGDQIAPSAPVEIVVTCRGFPTSTPLPGSKSHIQICVGSVAFDVQISRLPSGEKRGRSSWFGVGLSRRDSPPSAGTIHKCEIFVFASRSTSPQSNTTHFPSGDGTGAPTRLSFIMSSKVNGCLPLETLRAGVCATTEVVSARLIARKTFMSRKGSAEVADMQSVARVAHASRVLVSASRRNGLYEKSAMARTPSPTRETRALPGVLQSSSYVRNASRAISSRKVSTRSN